MIFSFRLRLVFSFFLIVTLIGIAATLTGAYFNEHWSLQHGMILFFVIIFAGMAGALLVYFILYRSILKPLKELAFKAQQLVGENNSTQCLNVMKSVDDEIVEIGKVLDVVASFLKEREKEMNDIWKEMNESKRLSILGQLAAGVAHEINNPLGGIVVYSNLLLEDTSPDDPRYSNIEKIIRESNRCKNIVKGLLDFARQSQPNLERSDVNKIITEALNNIRRESFFENIRIIEEYDKNLPAVFCDASQIQEVFENIIRNAAEVIDGSGEVTITSRFKKSAQHNPMVEILFADTGPGISPEYMERIFDPFFSSKKKGHGTGLGLAVSYGIVERHGGTMTAQNHMNGGAVFSVVLPVKEEEP